MSKFQNYFLGCVSSEGYFSEFRKIINKDGYYTYILKGGPGTGKSTLMKKAAEYFKEYDVEKYFCSSDMKSLDAVVVNDKKIIIVDGTSPHIFEADYPGVSQEIINLGRFWNKSELAKYSDEIKKCFTENAAYHQKAARYVKAISQINSDIYFASEKCIKYDKLYAYKERLCKKLFSHNSEKGKGNVEYKQLAALTADGYITHNTGDDYNIFVLKDNYFAGSDYLLRAIAEYASDKGYDVVASKFTLIHGFTFEHIIIPELKIAFITDNFINNLGILSENQINFSRFYDKDMLDSCRNRNGFNKKLSLELIKETANAINKALEVHDKLESYYINAIDFKELDKATGEFFDILGKDDDLV